MAINLSKTVKSNIPLCGLLALVIVVTILDPVFIYPSNILNILRQSSVNGLLAFGMTLVILTGGIDLSVGAALAFSSIVMANFLANSVYDGLPIMLALTIGAFMGAFNGIVIARGKVQPFIATLATMTVFRGLTMIYSSGESITKLGGGGLFEFLGRGKIHVVPVPAVVMFLSLGVLYFIMKHTVFGKQVYAIGGNESAARLSGVNIAGVKIIVYSVAGLLSALAGVLQTSRLDSAQPIMGTGYELEAIAAVVLGGTSLSGGRGSIAKTFIGVLLIAVLNNALNILEIQSFYQRVIKGGIILLAVIFDWQENSK